MSDMVTEEKMHVFNVVTGVHVTHLVPWQEYEASFSLTDARSAGPV